MQSRLAPVMTSVNLAKGLPNEHYTNPEVFEEEKRAVLFGNWAGVGFGEDVPDVGDAKPVNFLGMPLLILRDNAAEVTVFQNTCRHRSMSQIDNPACGRLRHQYPRDIKLEELGLIRIRAHVWNDVVFVNVSGEAPEFAAVPADLLERWKEYALPFHAGGGGASFKLEVENYCESHHLPWVHPGLNSYSRLEDHYNIEVSGRNMCRFTRTCFWVCTVIMRLRSFWSRSIWITRLSMWSFTTRQQRRYART